MLVEGKSMRRIFIFPFFLLLVVLLVNVCVCSGGDEGFFSVFWITDTQYLAESEQDGVAPLFDWIVENEDYYNLKMVVHSGDIVDDGNNYSQWACIGGGFDKLLNAGIPYVWCAGNHDQIPKDDPNGTYYGDGFDCFNPDLLGDKWYWKSSLFEGKNVVGYFEFEGLSFLVVCVEFYANDTVLAWVNDVLRFYEDANVFVVTHAYLSNEGSYNSWALHFQDVVLNQHDNIKLVLCGHYNVEPYARRRVNDGRVELFFNYQSESYGGACVRILKFYPSSGVLKVETFNPCWKEWLFDYDNMFRCEFNLSWYNAVTRAWYDSPFGVGFLFMGVAVAVWIFKRW